FCCVRASPPPPRSHLFPHTTLSRSFRRPRPRSSTTARSRRRRGRRRDPRGRWRRRRRWAVARPDTEPPAGRRRLPPPAKERNLCELPFCDQSEIEFLPRERAVVPRRHVGALDEEVGGVVLKDVARAENKPGRERVIGADLEAGQRVVAELAAARVAAEGEADRRRVVDAAVGPKANLALDPRLPALPELRG